MSPSGGDGALLIRVGDEERWVSGDVVLEITDARPYVDFLLPHEDPPRVEARTGAVVRNDEQEGWWRWYVISKPKELARKRRLGWCHLAIARPRVSFRVFLVSAQIFSEDAYEQMLKEISESFPGAQWDESTSRAPRGAVDEGLNEDDHVYRLADLLEHFGRELVLAESSVRNCVPELVPWSPSLGLSRVAECAASYDTPALQAVRKWVVERRLDLKSAEELLVENERSIAREQESVEAHGPAPHAWRRDRESLQTRALERLRAVQRILGKLDVLGRRLDELGVPRRSSRNPNARLAGRAGRLLRGLSRYSASSIVGREACLAVQPFSAMFEIWGAVELARSLACLPDCSPIGEPRMSGGLRPTQLMVRPRSVRWGFQLREWTVYLHYDHTARGVKPGGPKESSLLLSSWQRHAHGAVEADFQGYFTIGEANAPDYLLRVEGARGASFCFGDAKASDHRQDGAVASLAKQADDMSRKYSAKLGHRGQTGRIIHCVRSASFVLVPGDGYRWRDVQPDTDIVVMEALPGGAGGGPGSTHSVLPRVIETLIWHASGGRVEDLSRSEPAGAVVDVPKQGPPSPLLR